MVKVPCPSPDFAAPAVIEPSGQELGLDSSLIELTLHHFQVEANHTGWAIAQQFEQFPRLPGVILRNRGELLGMISRTRLLEYLIRPQGLELFLEKPLRVLHSYSRCRHLTLPKETTILAAAQMALRRSPDQQAEPLLVKVDLDTYCLLDIHELNTAYWQIRGIETQVRYERIQSRMIQAEKMAGLGRLVDGVAHEILDPVGFIWGNLVHVSSYTNQILELMSAYEAHIPQLPTVLQELREEVEIDYLKQDLPRAIDSIQTGADRLRKLATSLQNFCHIDDVYPKPADLHECLDSIILLMKSRLSDEIRVIRDYSHLPPVTCYMGQLGQVFMNILANAVSALLNQAVYQEWMSKAESSSQTKSSAPPKATPTIRIQTQILSASPSLRQRLPDRIADTATRWVSVRIADNGPGLSPEQQHQLLDSFSIEQRVAKETNLAVSYRIVTAKHGGELLLRSPISWETDEPALNGTEFEVLLPLV